MTAIDNIRRDIREASYLKYSPVPFAGAVHDFTRPMRDRLAQREYTGPYYYTPAKPGDRRGFYQSSKGLYCDRAGSTFDLRLEEANEHLHGSFARTTGYFCDDDGMGDTLKPIIARLPRGRGFLAGWTMGRGMCAALDIDIYDTPEDAARAAHDAAERDAEVQCAHEREESEKLDMEERALAAGWIIGKFGATEKWWNPANDDGARYVVDERSCRKICEDYSL